MPIVLEPLLKHVPLLMMVFFRMTGLFVITPMLSSSTVPMRIRVMLAFVMAVSIYPALAPLNQNGSATPESVARVTAILQDGNQLNIISLPFLLAMELMIGFVIGFGVLLLMLSLQLGGGMIDQQMGLGFAGIFNPEMNMQSGIVSQIFFLVSTTIFIILGGHRELFKILLGSFSTIPIGGYEVDNHVLHIMLGLLQTVFELTIRVAGPILVLVFLETVAMGMIARTVPQMNILSIGFPLRILMGMMLLVAIMGLSTELFIEQIIITIEALRQLIVPVP